MIQPSFSFLVGVALPFSMASRARRGESTGRSTLHAAWRAFVLVALGIFLRSVGRKMTNYTFEDTLTQIGLGYLPLFLIGLARPPARWVALAVILVGYWAAFAAYPAPGADFDYRAVGVPADWPHQAAGLAAHWNKNSNLAWAFDRLVPQPVSPGKAVHPQRGRVRHAQLHPDPRDDAPGPDRRRLAAGAGAPGRKVGRLALAAVVGGRRRAGPGSLRGLPDRQADLDARPGSCSAAGSASRRSAACTRSST